MKPFVKRQKNDAADAEAICQAALRPTMHFVPVKSEETQGAAMVFRIRELLIRQRTQAINALRGHLGEFGQVVPQGAANAARLIAIVEDPDTDLPADAIATLTVLVVALSHLDVEIERRAKRNEAARRLMTVPGVGPLIATALAALTPPPETFRKARDFAAWLEVDVRRIHRREELGRRGGPDIARRHRNRAQPAARTASATSIAYSRKITGSLQVQATEAAPEARAVRAIASGRAGRASRSIARLREISWFWQNLQARLQPAVP